MPCTPDRATPVDSTNIDWPPVGSVTFPNFVTIPRDREFGGVPFCPSPTQSVPKSLGVSEVVEPSGNTYFADSTPHVRVLKGALGSAIRHSPMARTASIASLASTASPSSQPFGSSSGTPLQSSSTLPG
jgi:hypothetical protein